MNRYISIYSITVWIFCISVIGNNTFSQSIEKTKNDMQEFVENWFSSNTNNDWLLEVNKVRFPVNELESGLIALEENLKNSELSKIEKEQLRKNFIENYINQSAILVKYYHELLEYSDFTLLLQEFLRQATTRVWLENKMKEDPTAVIPTPDEINKYYAENSERLLRLGLSVSQIKSYTEQELRKNKLQSWTLKQLEKFNTENSIVINPKLKKKYNID